VIDIVTDRQTQLPEPVRAAARRTLNVDELAAMDKQMRRCRIQSVLETSISSRHKRLRFDRALPR